MVFRRMRLVNLMEGMDNDRLNSLETVIKAYIPAFTSICFTARRVEILKVADHVFAGCVNSLYKIQSIYERLLTAFERIRHHLWILEHKDLISLTRKVTMFRFYRQLNRVQDCLLKLEGSLLARRPVDTPQLTQVELC